MSDNETKSEPNLRSTQTPATGSPTPAPRTTPEAEWVTLARLVRPQGRQGELVAEILTDFPELFHERRLLYLRAPHPLGAQPQPCKLETHRLHKDRLALKFAGVDSIEAANQLRGYELLIPRADRAPLEDGAVYVSDLVGCLLHDRATGTVVGEIVDVDRESVCVPKIANMDLLVVRRAGQVAKTAAGNVLVPFAKAYQPSIDLDARRMEMTLPAGLLDLDAPPSEEERLAMAGEDAAAEPPMPGLRPHPRPGSQPRPGKRK